MTDDRDRAALQDSVAKALHQLDGTPAAAVALLTGMTRAEIDELGGLPDTDQQGAAR